MRFGFPPIRGNVVRTRILIFRALIRINVLDENDRQRLRRIRR